MRIGAGPGGTCVNVGCVPKKLMYVAASVREHMVGSAEIASGYGFEASVDLLKAMRCNWEVLKERRDAYVAHLNNVYHKSWASLGVDVRTGTAHVKSVGKVHTVEVTEENGNVLTLTADKLVVAVGGVPDVPDVPGKELAITSDGFFDLATQPKKCAVFGAGYIAVEMAGILNALGTETTLFCRGDKVLRNEEVQ